MPRFNVELVNVTKRFGDFVAVDNISLGIEKGEFITLLGPSGCGKTTTLRMIGGFILPSEGEVYINGEAMERRPPNQRNTSMVFQNYALFPHLTVYENIAFGLKERKVPKDEISVRVQDILGVVGLRGLENRNPSELSGGQQQRVALARSLVLEPEVLLLDEPLGALDLKIRKQMQEELKSLQSRLQITFVYVTHDQEEALVMSNKIGVMDNGKLEQFDEVKKVYERPRTRFVSQFVGEANILHGVVIQASDRLATVDLAGHKATITNDCELQEGQELEFVVRPEKILFEEAARHAETSIQGKVSNVVYKGSTATITLICEGDFEVRAQEQVSGTTTVYEVGDLVEFGWLAECAFPILA
jgi:spermidine/putrescine transport system ATP-binding protein